MHRALIRTVAPALVLGAVCACDNDDDREIAFIPGVDTGVLVQGWTIEGTRDPAKCAQYGADRMRVVIFSGEGEVDATEFAPCAAFEVRLTLLTERYTGNATFLDANGAPVSATLPIPALPILDDVTTTQVIDFPAAVMQRP